MNFKRVLSGTTVAIVLLAGASQLPPVNAHETGSGHPVITSLAPMLQEVTPAVVSIRVSSSVNPQQRPFTNNRLPDELRRFFNFDETVPVPPAAPPGRQRQGAGSGVIIDAGKGLVVTNHHVVAAADRITVTLKDGRNYAATSLGTDEATDVALLQIPAENLVALEFADSDRAEVGDFVVAIGNPFGIGQTVTSGIISALGRAGLDSEKYEDFIQTDAAINVGNSGGALVDMEGRLLGINTAIISGNGGGSDGIGFAVPAGMVAAVVGHLERDGVVNRGMLGVQISSVTAEIAASLDLAVSRGALVTGVLPDSAAEKAGIRVYDIIVGIDGQAVESGRDLRNRVGLISVGGQADLTVVRNGTEIQVAASLGGEAGQVVAQRESARPPASLAGASLQSADARDDGNGGVLITDVVPRSRAWQAGLRAGDRITEVNRKTVQDLAEFDGLVDQAGALLALTVRREDRELLIMVS